MKRSILSLLMLTNVVFAQDKSKVIIEPVNFSKVLINDAFWKPKIDKVATKTLAACIYQTEEKTGKPSRDAVFCIELNFKVEAAQGFRSQRMALSEMDTVFQEAWDGDSSWSVHGYLCCSRRILPNWAAEACPYSLRTEFGDYCRASRQSNCAIREH